MYPSQWGPREISTLFTWCSQRLSAGKLCVQYLYALQIVRLLSLKQHQQPSHILVSSAGTLFVPQSCRVKSVWVAECLQHQPVLSYTGALWGCLVLAMYTSHHHSCFGARWLWAVVLSSALVSFHHFCIIIQDVLSFVLLCVSYVRDAD